MISVASTSPPKVQVWNALKEIFDVREPLNRFEPTISVPEH